MNNNPLLKTDPTGHCSSNVFKTAVLVITGKCAAMGSKLWKKGATPEDRKYGFGVMLLGGVGFVASWGSLGTLGMAARGILATQTVAGGGGAAGSLTKFGLDWSQRSGATELATSLNRYGTVEHAKNMLQVMIERREAVMYTITQNGGLNSINMPSHIINDLVTLNQSIQVARNFIAQ